MTNHTSSWSDQDVERLRVLLTQELSASQIAAALGDKFSRNAVIGKVKRLGLQLPCPPCAKPGRPINNLTGQKRPRKPQPPQRSAHGAGHRSTVKSAADFVEPVIVAKADPASLFDLRDTHCRAPLDTRCADNLIMYCGAAITVDCNGDPSSYCAAHHALFRIPPPRVYRAPPQGRERSI